MQYQYMLPPTPKTIKSLIYINVGIYLVLVVSSLLRFELAEILGLVPFLVITKFYAWQLFTYMFLHGSVFHLLLNMFVLWMFGSELCRLWGPKFFLKYYIICGIGAGICVVALSLIFPSNFLNPTIGSSGAMFGLFLAYGLIFKEKYLYVFGLIPVKARPLVIIMALIELVSLLSEKNSSISHLAHLGGLVTGLLYLKIKDWERKLVIRKYNKWKSTVDTNGQNDVININSNSDKKYTLWN